MTDSADKEPTMEEILSSIRRIISEEDEDGARADIAAAHADGNDEDDDEGEDEDEILELTDIVDAPPADADAGDEILVLDRADEEEAPVAPAPAVQHDAAPASMAAIGDAEEDRLDMAGIGDRDEGDAAPGAAAQEWETQVSDRLISDNTAGAAASAFARLQRTTRVPEAGDDKSLEAIVRELLRPMLKDWLDTNLPAIVERAVSEEVERIARQI